MFNQNLIETTKDIDALIRIAHIHPSERLREKLIDSEVDQNGNHIEPALAAYVWNRLIPNKST